MFILSFIITQANMKHRIFLLVIALIATFGSIFAEEKDNMYPTANRLFHIARSANKNLVCYDVNLTNGKLNTKEPLKVYWVNREEHPGQTEGLNYIQRKMAYGYKLLSSQGDSCICSLTAYPKRKLTIKQRNSEYICLININDQPAILQSLYVKASPRNPLHVEYVEIQGLSLSDNKFITERVTR